MDGRRMVVLWHGRGANEGRVLRPLAEQLTARGYASSVPEWNSGQPDAGAAQLRASLASARSAPYVLVGWSLGGAAALAAAFDDSIPRPHAVVALAAGCRTPSPFGVPLDVAMSAASSPPPIHLVHGTEDTVVPADLSRSYCKALAERMWPITLTEPNWMPIRR